MQIDAAVRTRERRAACAAMVVGAALMGVKFSAYALTRSSVVFADAMESIANVIASGVAFLALARAHAPADELHPYGHGKFEFVSAGLEGGMICVAGAVILGKAADELMFFPASPAKLDVGAWLLGATVIVNGAVGAWLHRLGTRGGSMTLEADGKHLIGDALTSLGTIAAMLLVSWTGVTVLDPILAAGFAVLIFWQGWRLVRRALGGLTDEQDVRDQRVIEELLTAHASGPSPDICSFHKVRHRHSGRYHWVDFHLQVPRATTVQVAHDVASAIEGEIERRLGEGDATAHVEPCENPSCPRCSG